MKRTVSVGRFSICSAEKATARASCALDVAHSLPPKLPQIGAGRWRRPDPSIPKKNRTARRYPRRRRPLANNATITLTLS